MKTPYETHDVECGPGWATLYQPLIDRCNESGFRIFQIKEKFGRLRFYVDGGANAMMSGLIEEAGRESSRVCELCGAPGMLRDEDGVYRTRCSQDVGKLAR